MSVPYSRLFLGIIPWYSLLIVTGAIIAIVLAVREEKRTDFKKDTILDFSLIVLPCGIIGARIYYVAFSWPDFKDNLISILRIWEGGIAIYGAVIGGVIAAFLFCRKRNISVWTLCDLIAPGLILAQAIGRWGNYFNQEAYGLDVTDPALCFFPFAVQIQEGSVLRWHMATFFYESLWNFAVFVFLMIARRKWFRYHGDVISFYALLYACGRLIIEDFRMDSLYASSGVRISQVLSIVICIIMLIRYMRRFCHHPSARSVMVMLPFISALIVDAAMILWLALPATLTVESVLTRFIILAVCSITNISSLLILYGKCAEGEIAYADIRK